MMTLMEGVPQRVSIGWRLLFLLNVAGGDSDGWVDIIKSFNPRPFNCLARFPLQTLSFVSIPGMTLSPFLSSRFNKVIRPSSKMYLGF